MNLRWAIFPGHIARLYTVQPRGGGDTKVGLPISSDDLGLPDDTKAGCHFP